MKSGAGADRVYIAHMLESIDRVMSHTAEGETLFRKSQLIQDAVIRNLQVMAESGQRLSEASRALAPDVPWRAISGYRHVMVHDH